MNDRIRIEDPQHTNLCSTYFGVQNAADKIMEQISQYKLPGLGMAYAILESMADQVRLEMIQRNYKLAAKHGVNFATHSIPNIERDSNGIYYVTVAPMDLIDQAKE